VISRVAITGVTGYIGGRLAPRLLDAGYSVRCLVRSLGKLQDRPWAHSSSVEVEQVDLADQETLAQKVDGCQAAFSLVHSMTSAGPKYAERDRHLATEFARAARPRGGTGVSVDGRPGHRAARRDDHRFGIRVV
jgi:uncharacterized protein YbjT (DUF2867 family)